MKRLLLVLVLSVLFLAGPVRAQESPALARLEISLWPEYDRSELLVIYRGELDPAVPLPVAIEIAIPARVGLPTAMAYLDEAGQRLTQQYTTRVEGDLLVVAFELSTQRFQLEYYDALPADASGKRTYTFAYTADYDTAELNLEFQQPPTAVGLVLNPPAETSVSSEDGLTYHLLQAGALKAGDRWEWTFTYTKNNSDLTDSSSVQATAGTPASAGANSSGNSTIWLALGGVLVLVAAGAGGYWFGNRSREASRVTQSARRPQSAPRKRRGSGRGAQPQQPRPQTHAGGGATFCHQCGAKLRSGSAFCHECGTAVRRE